MRAIDVGKYVESVTARCGSSEAVSSARSLVGSDSPRRSFLASLTSRGIGACRDHARSTMGG